MGKIDKEKLLRALKDPRNIGSTYDVVENFPEEPATAIDFDALCDEWAKSPCHCTCVIQPCNKGLCFSRFLKSKNLTQQKPRKISVKKTWSLKEKYKPLLAEYGILVTDEKEELPLNIVEFYDLKEEIDCSAIPKGSVVEVQGGFVRTVDRIEGDKMFLNDSKHSTTEWKTYNLIRVVEWAKEVTK